MYSRGCLALRAREMAEKVDEDGRPLAKYLEYPALDAKGRSNWPARYSDKQLRRAAAVIGTRKAMDGAHSSFISSTYWTEGVGPVAALATIRKMQQVDLPAHCERTGGKVQQAWRTLAERHGLPLEVDDSYPALAHCAFEHDLAAELSTLYTQLMLERGFLARLAILVTLAHTDEIIETYAAAIDEVFAEIADALEKDEVKARLKGPVAHAGFRRLL